MSTPQHYCLRWNNHRSNLLNVFEELLYNGAFTDVTLAVDSGLTVKCHKIVLAACSMYFQTLFHDLPNQQHPIVVLKDVKFSEIKALLEYMYRGEVNVAQDQLAGLLKVAQVLKVKGLAEGYDSRSGVTRDLRREDTMDTSMSPPPAISTSTGGGSGSHSSPPHSTGGYLSFYGKSTVSHDRGPSHHPNPLSLWSLPQLHSGAGHQLPTSLSSSALMSGAYDNGIETSPLKRRKLLQPSNLLMNNDTPILRTVLGQSHVDSSQAMPLLQPDSHESVHYRTASSNGSANDNDNRRGNDLTHSETVHPDVTYMDEDERQASPQSYVGDTVKNSGSELDIMSGIPAAGYLSLYTIALYLQKLTILRSMSQTNSLEHSDSVSRTTIRRNGQGKRGFIVHMNYTRMKNRLLYINIIVIVDTLL